MKTLIIDIETSPVMAKVWSLWKQNVSLDQIEDDWYIMSYSCKWLGDEDVFYNDCRENIGDDSGLLAEIHEFLDEADFVVAHNGDKFDIPKINARLILNGFPPPSPYKSIDTVKIAKKHFGFTSNKLKYLTEKLCADQKLDHAQFAGFKLWNECMAGNEDAWDEMQDYNVMDVISLEELYVSLRPWYSSHPNVHTANADGSLVCPKCGGVHIQKRGYYHTNKGKYQRYQCTDCGGWSSSTISENTTDERKSLLAAR